MVHRVQAAIDLSALKHNFRVAQTKSKGPVSAIIKANAYGHGLIKTAETLTDAESFGVTDVYEALQLKQAGCSKPIIVLQGLMGKEDIALVLEHRFQLVIHSMSQLALLEEALDVKKRAPLSPLTLWLKMDTGMGRLGLTPGAYDAAYKKLQDKVWVEKIICMTHLANASLPDDALTNQQLECFSDHTSQYHDSTKSIRSSAGILGSNAMDQEQVRPGLMLYGSSPFPYALETMRREQFDLQAVMTLQAKIISIKNMKAGHNIGYCSQYICPQDMKIGIVSIGYADGYPSNAPNGTPVLVNGVRSETLGRVSMDMIAVDLTHIQSAVEGDLVTLWGKQLSIDEIADKTGIISYKLTSGIANRVTYSYRHENQDGD